MIDLTVDIGNTSAKAALWDGGRPIEVFEITNDRLRATRYERAIVVSTRGAVPSIEEEVRRQAKFYIGFDHTTPTPVKNLYATPETLGLDRLAAAVGAHVSHPGRTMLVVDFGTAVTFDIVTAAGEYLGGNISPGAAIRFRALHEFTEALPLCSLPGAVKDFPAKDSGSAIENGVARGIAAEAEWYIAETLKKYPGAGVIFTGGGADYFAELVNFPIFATSELVFCGLNAILEHNANR